MCCPSRACCLCFLLVLVVALIGLVFGFGVFAHGFQKLKDALHLQHSTQQHMDVDVAAFFQQHRPFLGAPAPHQ